MIVDFLAAGPINDKGLKLPNKNQAEEFLKEAVLKNPGLLEMHSKNVAEAARYIAIETKTLNPETAYNVGLLHDIGKIEGNTHLHHIINGYNFLKFKGYEDAARTCLTHSFPVKDIKCYSGTFDCSEEEITSLKNYLKDAEYNDYDKLIQLCDIIAMPSGFCLIEKRLMEKAIKSGINELSVEKWKTIMNLKQYFETKMGKSIYSLLPGVIENTFNL